MDARDEQRSTDDRERVGAQSTSMPSSVATDSAVGNSAAAAAAPPACAVERETSRRSEVDQVSHPLAVPEAPRPSSGPLDDNEGPSSEPLRSIRLADLTSRHDADDQDAIARAAVAANSAPAGAAGVQQPVQGASRNEAVAVRRHLIRAAWKGFSSLTRGRKWIFIFKLLISLAQVVAGIVVLALPSSLGDSYSVPETCDPEGMFVFLTLHIVRVALCLPIDFYLGLSPHHTPRARRAGAEGQLRREQNRALGSLALDRKLSRLGDLLGFCHVVLFIVGNYVTWTSIECAHRPADSRPLWFTCISMLSISYAIIVEVLLLVFLVIFFLPTFVAIMRALGLGHRIPQRRIHPETGKVTQKLVDEKSKLVYFTPAEKASGSDDGGLHLSNANDSRVELERKVDVQSPTETVPVEALQTKLPSSRRTSVDFQSSNAASRIDSSSRIKDDDSIIGKAAGRKRLGLLLGWTRVARGRGTRRPNDDKSANNLAEGSTSTPKLKYPLYPLPAHRATCPICLCDFEEVDPSNELAHEQPQRKKLSSPRAAKTEADAQEEAAQEEQEPEPLRLMACGHVMHRSCVDQWLTTISGRCPVCQRPVDDEDEQQRQQEQQQLQQQQPGGTHAEL